MDRLNFSHFYYFYIVAKEGSIKGASEKLHVSQPTISDQLKLLEEYFQCKLFDRQNRSLVLNKHGKIALKYAEKSFDMANELTSTLRNKISTPKSSLDIGITHYMSHYFLYDTILPLLEESELTLNIKEKERRYLLADLEEGNIDMLFTDTKDDISSTMSAYRVGINKTFAIAHKKYAKYKRKFPKELDKIPFFNYANDSFLNYEIDLFFTKHSLSPRIIGSANDIDLFQVVTEKGIAFTIIPEVAKNRLIQNKDIIVLGELKELQTSVWGVIKNSYKGWGYKLLSKKI